MRVLHTSDWHLGRSFHGHPMLAEQRAFIDWLVAVVEAEAVELVIVAGDVYDRAVPPVEAVSLWQEALERISVHAPVVAVSGNHDSSTRLGFAGSLLGRAGIHLRTSVSDIDRAVEVEGADGGRVAVYGIPYLEPDLHREELGAERSHTGVLTAAMDAIRTDLEQRPDARSIVVSHAFITGESSPAVSESERDLRVGGIGDAPASVYAGVDYVALGHLHGPQEIRSPGTTVLRYSGSPVAFSFSEESHLKSVTILEVPAQGPVTARTIPVPIERPLVTLRGTLEDLLDDAALDEHANSWVRVVLTDARRPDQPMSRLRERWERTVALDFEPAVEVAATEGPPVAVAPDSDPVALGESFITHVTGTPIEPGERELLRASVEAVRVGQASA